MLARSRAVAALVAAATLIPAATAAAQDGPPPPPTAASGAPVETVASGVGTPTAFASDGTHVFLGSAPGEGEPSSPGGIWLLADGEATRIEGTPELVFGLAAHDGVLYASSGKQIVALSDFDGTAFGSSKVIYKGGSTFPGFNGIAIRGDRLFAGVSLDPRFDRRSNPHRYAESVVSMTLAGKGIEVVAEGLRQPWQLAFVGKQRWPLVTELAHDEEPAPKDTIVVARPNADYGFPTCEPGIGKTCKGFTKPRITLPEHASPMGIAAAGKRLYVALFGGIGDSGPEVVSMTTKGKKMKPALSGFVAPVVAVAVIDGTLYAGDVTGSAYATALR